MLGWILFCLFQDFSWDSEACSYGDKLVRRNTGREPQMLAPLQASVSNYVPSLLYHKISHPILSPDLVLIEEVLEVYWAKDKGHLPKAGFASHGCLFFPSDIGLLSELQILRKFSDEVH
jgi:hypothetical protein